MSRGRCPPGRQLCVHVPWPVLSQQLRFSTAAAEMAPSVLHTAELWQTPSSRCRDRREKQGNALGHTLGHAGTHSCPLGACGRCGVQPPRVPPCLRPPPPHAPTPPLLPAGPSLATLGLSKPRPSAASVGATQLAELQQPGAWGLCLRLGIAGHSSLWRLWGLKPPHSLATAGTASSTSSVPRHRLSDAALRSEPGSLSAVIIRSPRWLPRLDLGSSGLGDGH